MREPRDRREELRVLMTVDEMIEALHKAAELPYQAPAGHAVTA